MCPALSSPIAILFFPSILATSNPVWLLVAAVFVGFAFLVIRRKPKASAPAGPPLASGSSFRIDPDTGSLVFESRAVVLARRSTWKSVPETFKALLGPDRDMRTGWIWRRLAPLKFGGRAVAMSLGYHNDRLEMVDFSLLPPEGVSPWSEDPVEEEKILRQLIEANMRARLSKSGSAQYKWGGVYCGYDPKGGFTSAGINYTFFG